MKRKVSTFSESNYRENNEALLFVVLHVVCLPSYYSRSFVFSVSGMWHQHIILLFLNFLPEYNPKLDRAGQEGWEEDEMKRERIVQDINKYRGEWKGKHKTRQDRFMKKKLQTKFPSFLEKSKQRGEENTDVSCISVSYYSLFNVICNFTGVWRMKKDILSLTLPYF